MEELRKPVTGIVSYTVLSLSRKNKTGSLKNNTMWEYK